MNRREEDDYVQGLTNFRKKTGINDENVSGVIADRELALMNAIKRQEDTFSKSRHILCAWHIEKSIEKNWKHHFGDD